MKENKFLDEFFYYSSKIILIIPIIIVILALLIKFNQKKEERVNNENKQILISPKVSPSPIIDRKKSSFNLYGPLVCQYSDNGASVSAYIKNKNVYAKIAKKNSQENFLVKGDCLYHWLEKQYTGEKICGIGQYLNLIASLPFFDFSSLFKSSDPLMKELNFDQLISSCNAEKVTDKIFELPQEIIFKNSSLK